MIKQENLKNIFILLGENITQFGGNANDNVYMYNSKNETVLINSYHFKKVLKINKPKKILGTFIIDTMFFAYSNTWIVNYQHLISDFYPYLYYYKKYSNGTFIGIPKFIKSTPLLELLEIMNIEKENIIWLKYNIIYHIANLTTYKYGRTLVTSELDWSVEPLQHLNKKLTCAMTNKTQNKILFISRDDITTKDNNNNFAGKARDLFNKEYLYQYLNANNIDIQSMSQYSIKEKSNLLSNYNTFITLHGANVINLVFAKNINNLIILNNKQTVDHNKYFKELYEKMHGSKINLISIVDNLAIKYFNQPYIINIKELHNNIEQFSPNLVYKEEYDNDNIFMAYGNDTEFLREFLFKKLLQREPKDIEFNIHLDSIKKRGRKSVFYEFTGCYEYHIANTSDYMRNVLITQKKL